VYQLFGNDRLFGIGEPTGSDGRFTTRDLAPGRYVLEMRPLPGAPFQGAAYTEVTVDGVDVDGVRLTMALGATIQGVVVTDRGDPFSVAGLRVSPQTADPARGSFRQRTRVEQDGTFELEGLMGGEVVRVRGLPDDWGLRAISLSGRDVTDRPLSPADLNAGSTLEIVVTDRITRLSGAVTRSDGTAATDARVIVFAEDPDQWTYPSRHIQAVRIDQDGTFAIGGLPPGRYQVVAADYVPNGSWTSPDVLKQLIPWTQSFNLSDGQAHTLSLRLAAVEGAVR
jgi:hypothetical protein